MMRPVGKHVAEILVQLTESGLNPRLLELIGFSLGGQTVSYIARNYQQMTGKNISTIVSLEPSGPCFRTLDSTDRLDASNADFVQVIHTNIDGFGMATPMGHVDIYVNGGEFQPSELTLYPCTSTCSHFRVLTLWLAALKYPKKFLAIRCESLQQARDANCYRNVPQVVNEMGLGIDRSKKGIFYLSTGKGHPYYLGSKGLREDFAYWRIISDVNEGNETEVYT